MDQPSINPQIFRAYDIRGIVGKDLNAEVAELIAKAYGTWLAKRRVVDAVVGQDVRPSSDELKSAVLRGLSTSGINVYDLGISLSAMNYWAQYHFKTNGAVMVTASHNPLQYNGLKLASGLSKSFVTEEIQQIRKLVESKEFVSGQGWIKEVDVRQQYFDDLLKRVKLHRQLKVAVDTAHGTPGLFAKDLFTQAGASVIAFNTNIDKEAAAPDPTDSDYLTKLSYETQHTGAEVGLAFDTDGDRMGVVDEKGNLLWNDVLIALLSLDVLERVPGSKIVFNTLSSRLVSDAIEQAGGVGIMCRVGHSFVEQKMNQEGAVMGMELSGHFFFADNFYGFDDGFFSVLRLLDYLTRKSLPLSELVAGLPHYFSSPEIKIDCPDEIKSDLVDRMASIIRQKFPEGKFNYIDGVRVDLPQEMLTVRASQNGPYLTIRFEAKSEDRYQMLRLFLRDLIASFSEVDINEGVNAVSLLR